jgi:nucleoside-diphosphate-sugar epimerase
MSNEIVLVTGGTGFIAQHCIINLLQKGYQVRTTVRSLAREAEVRRQLNQGGVEAQENLTFVVADLMSDDGWAEAAASCTYVNSCFVDVRDVAELHLLAMTHPAANGERFLASSGNSLTMLQVAQTLRNHLGDEARKVSTQVLSDDMVRAAANKNPVMLGMVKLLGVDMNVSHVKASSLLGWAPRTPEEAIIATAKSLIKLGLVENK